MCAPVVHCQYIHRPREHVLPHPGLLVRYSGYVSSNGNSALWTKLILNWLVDQ